MKFFLNALLVIFFTVLVLPSQGLTDPITYLADLDGLSEAPPNASPGIGSATVTIDVDAHLLRVTASFKDLTGITTAAHIHAATATPFTGTVGVATHTPSFVGFPLGVTHGDMDETYDTSLASTWNASYIAAHGGTPAGAEAAFAAALKEGRAYFNIHSTPLPGGEIRGFLVAPAPATMLLFGTGLAGLAGTRLRRKKQ
jgi:hypothetical protein